MIVLKARWPVGSRVVALGLLMLLATLLMAAGMLVIGASPAEAATTFTVNKTGDRGDRNIDGVCDSKSKNGKQCTLRAAIEEANATQGADTIDFDISGATQTIKPDSPLPTIIDTVTIDAYTQQGASPNTLAEGNDAVLKVKLNGSDAGADANGLVISTSNSTVKGLVINRFDGDGVQISGFGATGNKVEGNFIGTNDDGTIDNGNGIRGLFISGADDNTVGGAQPDMRNVISGNDQDGVFIFGNGATDNRVEGNFIGTTADGSGDLGNTEAGVFIHAASDTTVGGTATGTRNVISGNNQDGVFIFGSETTVQGNYIGIDAGGTGALGNAEDGVSVFGADDNTVGGTAGGAGNRIAHNGEDGVSVPTSTDTGNSVLSNSIFSNGGLGIDLGSNGVTNNDTDDPDTGANNLQNFPVITSVAGIPMTSDTFVSGTLNSNPNQSFTIQCFLTDGASVSDHGEGSVLLDTTAATTDANGDGGFFCISSNPILGQVPGQTVSATATNILTTGDTSEFSENKPVPGPGP